VNDQGLSKGGKRREQILALLKRQGKITIQEIIDSVHCSEATARRDLDWLAEQGQAIRTIGGAQLEGMPAVREVSFFEKKQVLWVEKEAIARKAASMVREGDVVGLTGGTTTFLIARELKGVRGTTVVTNAVNIAMELADEEGIQVVLTGGVMRPNSFELCGPLAEKIIQSLNINLMFMGIDGVTAKQGFTTYSELEADIARLMMERSVRTYPVFDHTKVGRASLFSIAPLEAVDGCVTDRIPDEDVLKYLQDRGITVLFADNGDM
jgi:DeoR family transcriptional regulator of aga operon